MVNFRIQKNLRRSRKANRVGLMLFFMLLAILVASVFQGVRTL